MASRHLHSSVMFLMTFYIATIIFINSFEVSAYVVRRPSKRLDGNRSFTAVEKQTDALFKILNEMSDNELFKSKSCDLMEQEMPDFSAPKRRISEVKCLEQLWRIRFYDQLLLKKIRCKSDLEGAYITFATSIIYKGTQELRGKFTHTGVVGWETVNGAWIFLCGGALISDRFVITAAHCSELSKRNPRIADPSPKIVRLGERNILDSDELGKIPMDVEIHNFIVHDDYRYPYKYFDIALIELEESVPFKIYTSSACIWTNNDEEIFGRAYETGWGVVESDKTDFEPVFKIVEVDLMEPEMCGEKLRAKHTTTSGGLISHHICGNYSTNDTCKGDSGGPLMMPIYNTGFSDFTMHYIVGINSASYCYDSSDKPNIYTRVSSFVEWIEDIVWRNEPSIKEILSEKNFASIYKDF